MSGLLLDTHALYWLLSGAQDLSGPALVAIGESQEARQLFVSPISSWELALAVRKLSHAPDLGDSDVGRWFRKAVGAVEAKVIPIGERIAVEAANVALATGHKDPGDCFLIATARVRRIALLSRDRVILRLAGQGHLDAVEC